MISESYILGQFDQRPLQEQVDLLMQALDHMQAGDRRSKAECIALAMGIPLFPKVERIVEIDGYTIRISFQNGEERVIDFQAFLDPKRRLEQQLLEDSGKFTAVEVQDGTLVWPSVGIELTDEQGNAVVYPYDVDPGMLYEAGRAVIVH